VWEEHYSQNIEPIALMKNHAANDAHLKRAAEAIARADALFIGAGAGMGVDSGLPDFRGDRGFWRAYPAFEELGLNFVDLANPGWFSRDAELAWGFYGHRLRLYRETVPHAGFDLLRKWGESKASGYFVFTSNVDGQFQAAGFDEDQLVECHGSIHHFQCARPCGRAIWSASAARVEFDPATFRARRPLPRCPHCGEFARPNILMFGDGGFVGERVDRQERRLADWLSTMQDKRPAIIECGAGTAVPTVRWQSERLARAFGAPLIRINPREAHGPAGAISLEMGAAEALEGIEGILGGL
jgi:NAD-dependent SIR2 family protein deacetylase